MADWGLPTLSSLYADFLNYLTARDFDAISLGLNTITNPQTGMMRYVRVSNRFQEYDGVAWQDKILSIAGGGTGSNTPAGIIAALGLGTIAVQNANAVSITGGNISNVGSLGVNGAGTIGGNALVGGTLTVNGNSTIYGNLATGGSVTTNTHVHAVAGFFAGSPAIQLTVPDGHLASNAISGIIPTNNLGSGAANSGTFLRGDGTWATLPPIVFPDQTMNAHKASGTLTVGGNSDNLAIIPALTDYTKAVVTYLGYSEIAGATGQPLRVEITGNNSLTVFHPSLTNPTNCTIYLLQGK